MDREIFIDKEEFYKRIREINPGSKGEEIIEHESDHMVEALRLGYKPKGYRIKTKRINLLDILVKCCIELDGDNLVVCYPEKGCAWWRTYSVIFEELPPKDAIRIRRAPKEMSNSDKFYSSKICYLLSTIEYNIRGILERLVGKNKK
jgi:hypothetical protein